MLWRGTQTVAFGIKGKYVAAWYCNPSGASNANGVGEASATTKATLYKANVMKSCLKLDSTSGKLLMYNDCYNKRETAAHNEKRAVHESQKLTFKFEIAREIQRLLNDMPRGQAAKMPPATQRKAAYRDCGENLYTSKETSRLFTANLATSGWYAGSAQYDFAASKPKSTSVTAQSDQFTQLVWGKTKQVGFGIRGDTVVAWYCSGGNSPRTPSNFKQNVRPVCISGTGDAKWYSCYNKRAVDRHNRYRIIHATDATGFSVDEAAAKAIQKMLDANNSMLNSSDRPTQFRTCGQSKFQGASAFELLTSSEATDKWYGGKIHYNFAAGKPYYDSQKESALQFTQIVWKGDAGKRVGFGVKGTSVYAWYCAAGNTPDTPAAFKANVFTAGNAARCVDDTVNVCYNKKAILAHNDARARHGSPDLTYDRAIAKAAQAQLVKSLGSCGGTGTFKGSTKYDRPYAYQDCSENYYVGITYNVGTDALMSTDAATQHWLDGQSYWDYELGVAKSKQGVIGSAATL